MNVKQMQMQGRDIDNVEEATGESEQESLMKSLWPDLDEIVFAIVATIAAFVASLFPIALLLPL